MRADHTHRTGGFAHGGCRRCGVRRPHTIHCLMTRDAYAVVGFAGKRRRRSGEKRLLRWMQAIRLVHSNPARSAASMVSVLGPGKLFLEFAQLALLRLPVWHGGVECQ